MSFSRLTTSWINKTRSTEAVRRRPSKLAKRLLVIIKGRTRAAVYLVVNTARPSRLPTATLTVPGAQR